MSDPTQGKRLQQWLDLAAFLAVLATGILLIVLGRVTVGGLTTACAALAALFVAWKRLT